VNRIRVPSYNIKSDHVLLICVPGWNEAITNNDKYECLPFTSYGKSLPKARRTWNNTTKILNEVKITHGF